jgi:uncharacterized lipoprotein YddW (UPF0748 family)
MKGKHLMRRRGGAEAPRKKVEQARHTKIQGPLLSFFSASLRLCVFALILLSPLAIWAQTPRAPANVRAVWVRPLMGVKRGEREDAAKGKAHIRAELERLKRGGFNTIYVESIFHGFTMYPSKVLPQRPLDFESGAEWNVLQTYLDEGQRLNLSIHAWVHVFFFWHTGQGAWQSSPVLAKHPDWLQLDKNGSPLVESEAEGAQREFKKVFVSPSHPEVRAFLRQALKELATNYPALGGAQLDYIRYPLHWPQTPFDYSPDTLRRFKEETKLDAAKLAPQDAQKWQDWKTKQVTDAVRDFSETLRGVNPKLIISAAVFPGFAENLRVKMQDSQDWARRGYVDALLPMAYSRDFAKVENWCKEFRAGVPRNIRVYPALYVGHFYDANAKTLDTRYLELPAKLKMDGVGLFAAQLVTDDLMARLNW